MKIIFNKEVDEDFNKKTEKICKSTEKFLSVKIKLLVNISFVSEEEIRKLNLKHRKVDKVTDVLSFPMLEFEEKSLEDYICEKDPITKCLELGDIVICEKVAENQAQEYGHSYERELFFLITHGLLHLFGYDHESEEEEKEMMSLAEEILKANKITRGKN